MKKSILISHGLTPAADFEALFHLIDFVNGVPQTYQNHRCVFQVGVDIDAQVALINVGIEELGYPPIEAGSVAYLKGLADTFWTPECRTQRAAELAAAEAAMRRALGIASE